MRKLEVIGVILAAIGIVMAVIALIPAFGQWLFPREPFPNPTPTNPAAQRMFTTTPLPVSTPISQTENTAATTAITPQSGNLVINSAFQQDLSVGWEKTTSWNQESEAGVNYAEILQEGNSNVLHIYHKGDSRIRIFQEIPTNDYIPTEFSADFKFHLNDTYGHSTGLAYAELIFTDSAGQTLGTHAWYFGHYGRIRENIQDSSPPRDSPTFHATVIRELSPFGEWFLDWQTYRLDLREEFDKYLIGVDRTQIRGFQKNQSPKIMRGEAQYGQTISPNSVAAQTVSLTRPWPSWSN